MEQGLREGTGSTTVAVLLLALGLLPGGTGSGAPSAATAWALPSVLGPALQFSPTEIWRGQLVNIAETYGQASFIPYVWGGDAVGSADICLDCRACIMSKGRLSVLKRRSACAACRACGLDCSHFVNRIYREAGLGFAYASTRALTRLKPDEIRRRYGLVDLGRDVRNALPGDLLLHSDHIMLLLRLTSDTHGDILHVSRSITRKGVPGGVEIVRDADLRSFRGPLKRLLRHEKLLEPLEPWAPDLASPHLAALLKPRP